MSDLGCLSDVEEEVIRSIRALYSGRRKVEVELDHPRYIIRAYHLDSQAIRIDVIEREIDD